MKLSLNKPVDLGRAAMLTPNSADLVPLRYVMVGSMARVGSVVGRCEDVHRLKELGLSPGVIVEMVQSGNPCIIRFNGGKFCLRDDDTLGVLVDLGNVA